MYAIKEQILVKHQRLLGTDTMVRRYFFNARNEKHYNKKWRKEMGGYIGLESDKSEYIRGQITPEHKIQESIDALNAAITRLDNIINDMKGQTNGNNN
jgi:hypothetical protein